jgi:hypothetical protein
MTKDRKFTFEHDDELEELFENLRVKLVLWMRDFKVKNNIINIPIIESIDEAGLLVGECYNIIMHSEMMSELRLVLHIYCKVRFGINSPHNMDWQLIYENEIVKECLINLFDYVDGNFEELDESLKFKYIEAAEYIKERNESIRIFFLRQ